MSMRKSLVPVMLAVFVPLLAHAEEIQIVKIGFSSPLSGPRVASGKDSEAGLRMAAERLNARGLVVAGKKLQFEIVAEDDRADAEAGVAAAKRLLDSGVKAVMGPYNSSVALPASKLYNDAGVVMATVATNPQVTRQNLPYVFRVAASDSQQGGKLATFALIKLGVKTLSIVDDRTAYGQGLADEFEKVAKSIGIQVLGRQFTTDKATEFSSILTTIKAQKPDAVFYGGTAPQAGPMVRQFGQQGIKTMFLGGDGICSSEMGKLAGDAIGPYIYCTQGRAMLTSEEGKTFTLDFKKKFDRLPGVYAASFFDGLNLVAEAMKMAGSIEPKLYSGALAKIQYKGIAGNYRFDERHDLKEAPVTVFQFDASGPTAISSY
ncbi:MAG: branched-chain amino acid ABC transporter substrate-binding protein [Pseudomonadota bacterium]|nr:branched-chain amino acid ABC transporter substrate-binding protein [Pseudomonadota bacterium]